MRCLSFICSLSETQKERTWKKCFLAVPLTTRWQSLTTNSSVFLWLAGLCKKSVLSLDENISGSCCRQWLPPRHSRDTAQQEGGAEGSGDDGNHQPWVRMDPASGHSESSHQHGSCHKSPSTWFSQSLSFKVYIFLPVLCSQSFGPPGWEKGMSRESVLAVINLFNPGVSSSGRMFFLLLHPL